MTGGRATGIVVLSQSLAQEGNLLAFTKVCRGSLPRIAIDADMGVVLVTGTGSIRAR